ncbi:MAG: hypothetical protein DIU79_07450, partial [Actinobacteria bacterium]
MLAVVAVLLVLSAYLTWTAGRVDRLHQRVAPAGGGRRPHPLCPPAAAAGGSRGARLAFACAPRATG